MFRARARALALYPDSQAGRKWCKITKIARVLRKFTVTAVTAGFTGAFCTAMDCNTE